MTLLQSFKKQFGQDASAVGNADAEFKSFEEVYKTSYSHGLESIYALENVDIRSVRRIGESQPVPIAQLPASKKKAEPIFKLQDQFEFDFGHPFRGWIDSFILTEPIHVLRISPQAEKILVAAGKKLIQDIIGLEARDYLSMKGMGQGYIDEVVQKLRAYIEGMELYKCREINFTAFLRSLAGGLDRKKAALTMELFQLAGLFPLDPAESVEVKHLNLEKREEWLQQAMLEYKSDLRRQFVHAGFKKIMEVFVKPWIRQRNGIAAQDELEERLLRVSQDGDAAQKIISFLNPTYFDGESVFQTHLLALDAGLYCADAWTMQNYRLVIQKAYSYFYKPDVVYNFARLVSMMEREFGLEWISFPEGFIEKALRYCPAFRVRKGPEGLLQIRLS